MDRVRLLLLRWVRWRRAELQADVARRGRGIDLLDEADPWRGIIARF